MELFVVNRYVGENGSPVEVNNESELKKNLLEKINYRRKLIKHAESPENNLSKDENDKSGNSNVVNGVNIVKGGLSLKDENVSKDLSLLNSSVKDIKKKGKKRKTTKDESPSNSSANHCKVESSPIISQIEKYENKNLENENTEKIKPFAVLGVENSSKGMKVKRSIPQWLANPSIVSVDLQNKDSLIDSISDLDQIFVETLRKNNITHFFPVQKQVIPWLLKNFKKPSFYWPSDICVSAPTGSGKTLAFVLPILQALYKRTVPQIRAIVVLPVQDLAVQVYKVFETYSAQTELKVLILSKKRPFIEEQTLIRRKDDVNGFITLVDIIVTTAGRLVDHLMMTDGFLLEHLKYLVIDEADRVMEDIQNDWLYHLNKKILKDSSKSYQTPVLTLNTLLSKKKLPQKLLFSATLSQDPEKLQQLGLFQPKLFTSIVKATPQEETLVGRFVGKYTTPAELTEYFTLCSKPMKPLAVHYLLSSESWRRVLCFVNSIQGTQRLAFLLRKMNRELKVKSLSTKLNPRDREKLINDFSMGQIDVLISTDALTRGIDLPDVKYVISYNSPKYLKTYIHRIGRTGRAGKSGVSLILLTKEEEKRFKKMIETCGKKYVNELHISDEQFKKYIKDYEIALKKLESHVIKGKKAKISAIKSNKFRNKNVKLLLNY